MKFEQQQSMFTLAQMGLSVTAYEEFRQNARKKMHDAVMTGNGFFIPGNAPSLKNEHEIVEIYTTTSSCCGKPVYRTGSKQTLKAFCTACNSSVRLKRPIIVPKKIVKDFYKSTEESFMDIKPLFETIKNRYTKPYIVGFYFVRDSNRIFDYFNAAHIILDLLVEYEMIEDDNSEIILPIPIGYEKDADAPGTYFRFLDNSFLNTLLNFL